MEKDYFDYCDAFIILTRQGVVLVSDGARITAQEDQYLSELTTRLIDRAEQVHKAKGRS